MSATLSSTAPAAASASVSASASATTPAPAPAPAPANFTEPAGIAPRGTLLVLPGRGEGPQMYQRFGQRISADAYRVIITESGADQIRELIASGDLIAPVVILGADAGAITAIDLLRNEPHLADGVILVGLALAATAPVDADLAAEIATRTACPNHQRILRETGGSSLFTSAVTLPITLSAQAAPLQLPLLAIHGDADPLTPLADAVHEYRALGAASILTVTGGLHDILNDVTHRSVAASIILFLEQLRDAQQAVQQAAQHAASLGELPPVVRHLALNEDIQ